ncbi:DedA family protein [Microbacterium sp. JZ31]|uniref:DedA family protein n=1 Tax=Microbacterium sp. JZ31 TaxID=1906274 RepID=UPI001931590C|nr:DedA family protein [Microbacterium sp. JZ31]
MDDALRWLLDIVESVDPVLRTALAGLAILLETSVLVGVIVPGDTVVIVAATGVRSAVEGVILAVVVIIGSLAGESIGFGLGRWLGPHIRASWMGRRIGERNWLRAERYVQRRGGIAIFLSRFLPVLHSLVPLTVGMSTYTYRRFILWTFPACVIWATLYVSVAAGAAQSYRRLSDDAHWAGYIFVGAILLLVVGVFVAKKVIARLEQRHFED